jgi:hypothetical protein
MEKQLEERMNELIDQFDNEAYMCNYEKRN